MTSGSGTPVVTIDGPAASGKSSVSREVSKRLGWSWVSTGAFYRALAYLAQRTQTPLDDEIALSELAKSPDWSVKLTPEHTEVWFQGSDVTAFLHAEEVGVAASQVSRHPLVRAQLLQAQRDCVNGVPGLIAEGRDCGTVVFPQADVKIYLTARSESRAQRRVTELGGDLGATKAAQQLRDTQDRLRKAAPLKAPENSHVIDTSEMNLMQVVDVVTQLVISKFPSLK